MKISVVALAIGALGCRAADPIPTGMGSNEGAPPSVSNAQHIAVEGVLPAGADFANPDRGDSASVVEGRKLFTSMNCDGCHGGGATGFIAPSLSDGRWRYGGAESAIFQSIYYGRPQGMPAFGGVIKAPVVWKLVTYLKSLPKPAAVPTQSW